ncbi:MAG: GNAT family N-acetyltransferase [Actinomycetes bacterium]
MSPVRHPRAASAADLPVLRELLAGQQLPDAGLAGSWAVWVVDGDEPGALAGAVALERHQDRAGTAYLLRSLVVADSSRDRGIGGMLVRTALAAADSDVSGPSPVALLTETADGYFPRFGFTPVQRADLPAALSGSPELSGGCPGSARAYLRPPQA